MITDFSNLPLTHVQYLRLKGSTSVRHSDFDFIYVLQGQITLSLGKSVSVYHGGMVRLIDPETDYTAGASSDNTVILLGLKASFVRRYIGSLQPVICDSEKEPRNSYLEIKKLITQITGSYLEGRPDNFLSLLSMLYRLLDELRQNSLNNPEPDTDAPEKYKIRIRQIISYIDENYQEAITLSDLADELSLTPQYLSKFFNRYLQTNFKQYLLDKRLAHAWREISYTDDSITEISIRCGFSDVSAFSRSFRLHFGENPTAFRRIRQNKLKQDEYTEYSIDEILPPQEQSPVLPNQEIAIDTTHSEEWKPGFSSLINISYARNMLDNRQSFPGNM